MDHPSSPSPSLAVIPVPWHRALRRRCAMLWPLKMVGNSVAVSGFFPLYFWVMERSLAQAWVLPLTAFDRWLELRVAALPLYASLWVYIALPLAFAQDRREVNAFALRCAVMTAIALTVFWFLPTAVPVFPVEGAAHPALQFLKATDAAGNAFPSLHVAFAVLACAVLVRQLREVGAPLWARALNVAWAVGIVYSTMAVRQHVAIDVAGGLVLGAACCGWRGKQGTRPVGPPQAPP